MSKFKLTLNEALQLKDTIQDKLIRYQFIFKNENSVPEGRKRNYDLKALVKKDENLRQKMVTLKLLIHEANLFVPEKAEHCIAYYVFLLSEKKRQINNLKSMPTDEGFLYPLNQKGKLSVIFNEVKKTEWIDELNKEYRDISNKLTELNQVVTIELPFDPKKV